MNIAQLSEQLKDVPQNRLVDYARNPNSVVPQFLALAEIQRRQHLQNTPQPPAATVAEDVLAQAAPQQMAQQLPENQPGVAQLPTGMPQGMASGGIVAFAGGGNALGYDDEDEDDLDEKQANREESRIRSLIAGMRARVGNAVADVPRAVSAVPTAIAGIPRAVESAASGIKSFASNLPKSYETAKAEASLKPDTQETDVEGFLSKIQHLESRGKHFNAKGEILTSPKGAEGIMQVMPKTQRNPGFGVTPARDRSPEELKRVGDEYGIAMLREFKDPKIAAMAYNWGPKNVKDWLASDRSIPIPKETQKYISHFAQGGIASFSGTKRSDVEEDEPTSTLGSLFSFLKQTPEQAIFAKNYLENAQRKKAAQEALIDPELDVPFYKAIRPSERKLVDTRRAEILRSLIPQTTAISPTANPALADNRTSYISPTSFDDNRDVGANQGITSLSGMSYADLPFDMLGGKPPQGGIGPFDYEMGRFPEQTGPDRPSFTQEATARINQDREDLKAQAEQDKYLALLQAGLGMMSGTSPYAMANIGQGGMQGVAAYAGAKKQRALERLALGKEELSVRRLEQLSDSEKAALAATMGYKQEETQRKLGAETRRIEEKYVDNFNSFVTGIYNRAAKTVPLKDINGLPIEPEERIRLIQMEEDRLFQQNKKILQDLAQRAKISLPDFSAPLPRITTPVKKDDPGFFGKLFGGNKQSSGAVDTSNALL